MADKAQAELEAARKVLRVSGVPGGGVACYAPKGEAHVKDRVIARSSKGDRPVVLQAHLGTLQTAYAGEVDLFSYAKDA